MNTVRPCRTIRGVGPIMAGRILARTGDPYRFPHRARVRVYRHRTDSPGSPSLPGTLAWLITTTWMAKLRVRSPSLIASTPCPPQRPGRT
ncbi:IS110 family transposase [Rhodococcus sp. WB9]|uniref:transposase n=1 Tax=Rhodococcus sp. WB9 TaxID=2594007 RepID=UPI0011851BB2|nr:IS110 family transposase [Rhodococcus sp. WB9]